MGSTDWGACLFTRPPGHRETPFPLRLEVVSDEATSGVVGVCLPQES